ncbi:hypothetical protein BDR22DRAFT_65563 [Usnea florida]
MFPKPWGVLVIGSLGSVWTHYFFALHQIVRYLWLYLACLNNIELLQYSVWLGSGVGLHCQVHDVVTLYPPRPRSMFRNDFLNARTGVLPRQVNMRVWSIHEWTVLGGKIYRMIANQPTIHEL